MTFDPVAHANQYTEVFYQGLFDGAVKLDDNKIYRIDMPSAEMGPKLLSILRDMARSASVVLELGPFLGNGSTQALRQGLSEDATWATVDVVDHILPWLKPIERPGWSLVIGSSIDKETVQRVDTILDGDLFDLVFIDTVHTYEHLKKELEMWSPLAANSCTWLFHDTWMGGVYNPMTDAIKEFAEASDGKWEYADISKENNGLGALVPV